MSRRRASSLFLWTFVFFVFATTPAFTGAQDTSTAVNVTIWQQDSPNAGICSGCVYRTGQNLKETAVPGECVPPTTSITARVG
jgi:hypothetical protein